MDFSLTEEQTAISDLAEKILSDHSSLERLKGLEESSECIDREAWAKLAEAGLVGLAIPEENGGAGSGFVELCLVLEQVGKVVAHVPFLATAVYGALPVARFGSAAQKERLLPGVAAGTSLLSAALGEIGSDPRNPQTTARKTADGYQLDGTKIAVPIAEQAEAVLVPAQLESGGTGVFVVDPRGPGVTLEAQETFNWETQHKMTLAGVTVTEDALLGDAATQGQVLDWTLDRALTGLCAIAFGVSQSAMRITAEYAAERKQFDKPIATFQAVSQRMGDCFIDNEAIGLTMWQAATRLADEMPSDREIATAKFWAGDGGSRIGHAALHIHGGISIDVDYPIQRYFLWAKQVEYTLGAGTEQLKRLGASFTAE